MAQSGYYAPFSLSLEEKDKSVRKTALDMKSLLCANSKNGIFPEETDGSNPDYPDVDCNQVYPNLYLGNQ